MSSFFYNLYSPPNIIRGVKSRRLQSGGHVARMGHRRVAYRAGKPEGKRPLGRPSQKWEDNIKMDLQITVWGGGVGQD